MTIINFKNKDINLKYKTKYINLKNYINNNIGGDFWNIDELIENNFCSNVSVDLINYKKIINKIEVHQIREYNRFLHYFIRSKFY